MEKIGSEVEVLKQQLREAKRNERIREQERKKNAQEERQRENKKVLDVAESKTDTNSFTGDDDFLPLSWSAAYLPVDKIKNGIIYTTDGRYVKIIEVLPINFALRSPPEQRSILASFMGYLKIAPDKIQMKVVSKKAEVAEYIRNIQLELEQEQDPHCRMLQEDYMRLIKSLGRKEGITRRFFWYSNTAYQAAIILQRKK